MTAPKQIWAYSASGLSFDEGEWDQSESPQCGHDWPHARYVSADAPELLALVAAARALRDDFKSYKFNHLGEFYDPGKDKQFAQIDAALSAYEAMK